MYGKVGWEWSGVIETILQYRKYVLPTIGRKPSRICLWFGGICRDYFRLKLNIWSWIVASVLTQKFSVI